MHQLNSIAERMKETLTIGFVDYADQYLFEYNQGSRDTEHLAWVLASYAVFNEKYNLLEQSLLELLPELDKPINILMALLDSNLGWDENTDELFMEYAKTLSDEDRQIVFKASRSQFPKLLL